MSSREWLAERLVGVLCKLAECAGLLYRVRFSSYGAAQALLGSRRSSSWPRVSAAFLEVHRQCCVCGKRSKVAHHERPFHLFPELELDAANLMPTCGGDECHRFVLHAGDYRAWNPQARDDAALIRRRQLERRYTRAE